MNRKHLRYVDQLIESYIEEGNFKDVSIGIVTRTGIQYKKFWGDFENSTVYRIFSMTKPLTAVGIYLLLERGKITLSQPLKDFFPEFQNLKVWDGKELVSCSRDVKIYDLINMVSGMPYPGDGTYSGEIMKEKIARLTDKYNRGYKVKKEEILHAFAETPLVFQPGEYWHYGVSADVLGMVIEIVSGKTLDKFFSEELFIPLEMYHSGFWIKKSDEEKLAKIYTKRNSQLETIREADYQKLFLRDPCLPPAFLAAGSGMYSTLDDYSHFMQMLINRGRYGRNQVLSESSIRVIEECVIGNQQKKSIYFDGMSGYNYGSLMRHLEDPKAAGGIGKKGEYGWDGLLGNDFFICPELGFGYIFFQQIFEGANYTFRQKLRKLIYTVMEGEGV